MNRVEGHINSNSSHTHTHTPKSYQFKPWDRKQHRALVRSSHHIGARALYVNYWRLVALFTVKRLLNANGYLKK